MKTTGKMERIDMMTQIPTLSGGATFYRHDARYEAKSPKGVIMSLDPVWLSRIKDKYPLELIDRFLAQSEMFQRGDFVAICPKFTPVGHPGCPGTMLSIYDSSDRIKLHISYWRAVHDEPPERVTSLEPSVTGPEGNVILGPIYERSQKDAIRLFTDLVKNCSVSHLGASVFSDFNPLSNEIALYGTTKPKCLDYVAVVDTGDYRFKIEFSTWLRDEPHPH